MYPMSTKRIPSLTLTKHFDKPVAMTYANGNDQQRTRGFTATVTLFQNDVKQSTRNGADFKVFYTNYFYGAWEIASDNCDNENGCYGEGTLTFELPVDGKAKCFDYDGCFDLSHQICDMLTEAGFDMTEVDSRLF